MRNWFSQNSAIARVLHLFADIALLNLFWLVCSLPIITLGSSTAALYSCLFAREQGEPCGVSAFFQAFRARFRRATLLWLIVICAGIILYVDYLFTMNAPLSLRNALITIYVAIALVGSIVLSFLFTPPVLDAKTAFTALKSSLILGGVNLPRTILVLLFWSGPAVWLIASSASFWRFAWIWVGFGFGGIAYLCVKLMKKALHFKAA